MKHQDEAKPEKEIHTTTLRLPVAWYRDLRRQAFEQERPMQELIKDALREKFGYQDCASLPAP